MDRTQDSGSWNVGSTPTWRIFCFTNFQQEMLNYQHV